MDDRKLYMVNKNLNVDFDEDKGEYTVSNEKKEKMVSKGKPEIGCSKDEDSVCFYDERFDHIKCWGKKR